MLIGWTTVATPADADRLAAEWVRLGLAACVQIDGPIVSHYHWQGQAARDQEFRLTVKFLPSAAEALERSLLELHPYDTPEWVVVKAEHVGEKYLSWAKANSSNPPL